jgi:hypothetical protein
MESCPAGVEQIYPVWSGVDEGIVEVHPATGLVTGLQPGETEVHAIDPAGGLIGIARVTVQ